jgi:hypothetical protein
MIMSEFGVVVTIGTGIFGVLVVMLGFVVRVTIKWTEMRAQLRSLETNVGDLMRQLVSAITRDNDHETRITVLESNVRHGR